MRDVSKFLAGFKRFQQHYLGERHALFDRLLALCQQPHTLMIACCDSRCDPALLTDCDPGDMFVVRNVANLVPPHDPVRSFAATSSAMTFAISNLEVLVASAQQAAEAGRKSIYVIYQHTTLEPTMPIKMPSLTGLSLACLLAVSPALAAEEAAPAASLSEAITQGKSISSFRLRYEYVDQAGKDKTADAWTLRSLIGWRTKPFHDFSVIAQLIGVSPLNHQYNDLDKGVPDPKRLDYPVVADPEDYDINQLYLEWSGLPATKIRLGRQAVFLDNWRFVGDVRFRQVMQVMDGVALENRSLPDAEIYVAHFERIKQITTKRQDVNVELMNVKYRFTPSESLSGYGYLVDWNGSDLEANSSKTFGLRLDGVRKVSDHWKLLYTAEYAKQDDYRDGHRDIDNHYYRIGAGLGRGDWFLRVDQEKLSGNGDGRAFQTPLGTNHLFQGWADVFLATPAEGVEDSMLIAGGKFRGVTLKAEYHWIDADRNFLQAGGGRGDRYGEELDLSAGYSFGKQWNGLVEYANFREKDEYAVARKRNIEKIWLTLMYSF